MQVGGDHQQESENEIIMGIVYRIVTDGCDSELSIGTVFEPKYFEFNHEYRSSQFPS